jgi:hypothetical protein
VNSVKSNEGQYAPVPTGLTQFWSSSDALQQAHIHQQRTADGSSMTNNWTYQCWGKLLCSCTPIPWVIWSWTWGWFHKHPQTPLLNLYHSSIKKNNQNTAFQAPKQYSANNMNAIGDMGIKMTRKISMTQLSAKTGPGPTVGRTPYSKCLQKRINLGCTSPTVGYMEPDKCPISEAQTQFWLYWVISSVCSVSYYY